MLGFSVSLGGTELTRIDAAMTATTGERVASFRKWPESLLYPKSLEGENKTDGKGPRKSGAALALGPYDYLGWSMAPNGLSGIEEQGCARASLFTIFRFGTAVTSVSGVQFACK